MWRDHTTPTARDRDRLRQQILERLNWNFYRIWSTDWFRNPDAEVDAVLSAVRRAVKLDQEPPENKTTAVSAASSSVESALRYRRPPIQPGFKIDEYEENDLRAIVHWIKSDTMLRTDDELLDEVMFELGFRRHGSRIVEAIESAIQDEKP